jgi:hypothetical protein
VVYKGPLFLSNGLRVSSIYGAEVSIGSTERDFDLIFGVPAKRYIFKPG